MGRRGFFAEVQHQVRVAARETERRERQAARAHAALVRRLEQARKAEERAKAQLAKSAESERKRLEKEAKEAHLEAMQAQVEERNAELAEVYDDLDSLLASTLSRDDYVDLRTLRVVAQHPPFEPGDLATPIPQPEAIPDPPKPVLVPPDPPRGLAKLFGQKKHAQAVADAERAHEHDLAEWRAQCKHAEVLRQKARQKHAQDEVKRLEQLKAAHATFAQECKAREDEAAESNSRLEELIANLGYGAADAVQEYVAIVLSNSVYPAHFPVSHQFEFDPSSAELRLSVSVPGPQAIPEIKGYKYARASDEITSTALSQRECRERYASAVHQVALRSFHEVFESDRRALIRTISLDVGADTVDPATGRRAFIPLIVAAAARDAFLEFDLSAVVPALTLSRLGASVSKNPYGLAAVERAGVRST
jgi:restriction system protein